MSWLEDWYAGKKPPMNTLMTRMTGNDSAWAQ